VVTRAIDSTSGAAAIAPMDHSSSDRPATIRSSLSIPSIRRDTPAATTIASAVPVAGASTATCPSSVETGLGEDHPARHRLEDAGHRDVEVLVDVTNAALDHDHRAVVEEAHTLARFLALLDHPDPELLARQHRRLHGIGERVDVEDADALELGDPVQVVVVGQDRLRAHPGEGDELGVDLGDVGHGLVDDLDRGRRVLLHLRQDLEAAPAAVATERVRAVRDVLELVEDELRDNERAVDEARIDDLGDPAVDDRARVDDDVRIARGPATVALRYRTPDDP